MMQQTKKKMVLEHLVVHKMNTAADLKQVTLQPTCQKNHFCDSPHLVCTCPCCQSKQHSECLPSCLVASACLGVSQACFVLMFSGSVQHKSQQGFDITEDVAHCIEVVVSWLTLVEKATIVPLAG